MVGFVLVSRNIRVRLFRLQSANILSPLSPIRLLFTSIFSSFSPFNEYEGVISQNCSCWKSERKERSLNFFLQCCKHGETNLTYMVVCRGVCEPRDLAQWTWNNDCDTWCCALSKSQTNRGSRQTRTATKS